MARAWKRVKANHGSAGVDGRTIELSGSGRTGPRIRDSLLDGSYRPEPVRRVQIPKPEGGERDLGISTVVDRLIQQALLQVLQPRIGPTFSEHSYGFGRAEAHTMRCDKRSVTCRTATGWWWMWIWPEGKLAEIFPALGRP